MRRGRSLIILGLLLIIAVGAGAFVYFRYFQPVVPGGDLTSQPTQPEVQMVEAVRMTQNVSRGTIINETMLDRVSVPQETMLPGMFTDFAQVVGRKAKYDLEAGLVLNTSVLLNTDDVLPLGGSDWALVVEPGKLAISVPITRLSAISYAPQAGDHVDVIATMLVVDLDEDFQAISPNRVGGVVSPGTGFVSGSGSGDAATAAIQETETLRNLTAQIVPGGGAGVQGRTEVDPVLGAPLYLLPSENQRPRMVSQSILKNVTVLRVGNFPVPDSEGKLVAPELAQPTPEATPAADGQAEPAPAPTVVLPDVITLIVTPQDAITLNYLIFSGAELTLGLRAAGDNSVSPTEAVTLQYLMDQYNIPVPVRLPFGMHPRVDELVAPVLTNDTLPTPEP